MNGYKPVKQIALIKTGCTIDQIKPQHGDFEDWFAGAMGVTNLLQVDVFRGQPLPAAENLAGYKIYWRLTTDAQWTWSRDVGKVGRFTLENVVIDNYLFGVASVSKDGYESPVVFPGPTGSFGN